MTRNTTAPRKTKFRQSEQLDMGMSGRSTISDEWMLGTIQQAIADALIVDPASIPDINREARTRAALVFGKGKKGNPKDKPRGRPA